MATASPAPAKPKSKGNKRHARGRGFARPPRALVLSPTRELAAQIDESLRKYGRFTSLYSTVVYGGVSQFHQVKALQRGVDALVATPGRLLDLMNQGHVDLSKIEFLVFDEADQMLDMGFLPDLKRIVKSVPAERQTLMFSATMPKAIRELAQHWLKNPESIEVTPASTPGDRIAQSVHLVDKQRKPDLLVHYLTATPRSRTLVFSRTKHGADKIVKRLMKKGHEAAAIHGDKSQGARNRALARFKSKRPPVLVATDIAARGLDISNVSHVVNYDLPETPEIYVHRIGRTARAGASGVAISFCSGDERGLLRQIERLTKAQLPVEPTVEGFEPVELPPKPAAAPKRRRSSSRGRPGKPGKSGGSKGGARAKSGNKQGGKSKSGVVVKQGGTSQIAKPRRRPKKRQQTKRSGAA